MRVSGFLLVGDLKPDLDETTLLIKVPTVTKRFPWQSESSLFFSCCVPGVCQ